MRLALALGVFAVALRFVGFLPLQLLDARAVDYRLLYRGAEAASDDVVIVAIDDASLDELGRWPWPRTTMAELVDRLAATDASVVGFDIVQSERTHAAFDPEALSKPEGLTTNEWNAALAAVDTATDQDRAFADALARDDRFVLGYFYDFADAPRPSLRKHDKRLDRYDGVLGASKGHVPRAVRALRNLPVFEAAVDHTGYFNVIPDAVDGSFRSVPMVVEHEGEYAVPLSLSMLRVHGGAPLALRLADFGVESVRLGSTSIPVSEDGQLLLNYRGPGRTFEHISAADVIRGRADASALAGKLVLVGVTAGAVADVRVTPFDPILPGVEMHATVIDNVLREDFLLRPSWVVLLEMAQIMIAAILLGWVMGFSRGVRAALMATTLTAGYLAWSQVLFVRTGIPLGIVFPVAAMALIYSAVALHHYVFEATEKRRIRDAFGVYVNPALAERLSSDPSVIHLGGERRELTVLFSDIRGFTSMSEGMAPEDLVELLNDYLGEMTGVIFENDGTLDKYIGDAIMAVWGAPLPDDEHALGACRAALGMRDRLDDIGERFEERGWPKLEMGVGVHTGEMVAGNMGSSKRLSYTVMGDNVNLGSRLEGLTKYYGVPIIVSEETLAAAEGAFAVRELDLVRVKGRETPVRIFELLGESARADEWSRLVERFNRGLDFYRKGRFDEAASVFAELALEFPNDGPSRLYLQRLDDLNREAPPPEWDAVCNMESK